MLNEFDLMELRYLEISNLKQMLFVLLLMPAVLCAQEYFWPTNASTYMSSSFCEFRDGHYHSAIDIKTWLREGYNCFAIGDGEIVRIRVSPFGYGKVLYLRLKDGNTAVYAHLQGFPVHIEKQIRRKQLENKRYSLDWSPRDLKVKKGDIIAYTGRTGTGLPHLHFEIRNTRGHPVNPLAYYDEIKDTVRPSLEQLAVIPLDPGTTVNSSYTPQIIDLLPVSAGKYRVKQSIHIRGRAGLALRGVDRANDVSNKYGFYRTRLEIDRRPVFQITYDELDFATTEHIFTELYYPLWIAQKSRFHKLYVESFNPLPFYIPFPASDGSIVMADSALSFKIEVADFFGNRSLVEGILEPETVPPVLISNYQRAGQWAYLDFISAPITDLSLYTGSDPKQLKSVNYFEITSGKIHNPDDGVELKIDLENHIDQFLELHLSFRDRGESVVLISPSPPLDIEPEIYFMGDQIVLEIDRSTFPLSLSAADHKIPFQNIMNERVQALVPSAISENSPLVLSIEANSKSLWADTLNVAKLFPDRSQKISWFDSALTIISKPGAVIEPFLIAAARHNKSILSDSLPLATRVYEIYPASVFLFKNWDAYLLTDSLPDQGTWALFRVSDSGSLSFAAHLTKHSANRIQTRIGGPGKYTVACDTIPPVLDIVSPVNGAAYKNWPKIRFYLHDRHSKIGGEENISILLNGEFILPEWDPEDNIVEAVMHLPPVKGTHILTISVSDRSNNITRKALMFSIP